MGNDEEEYDDEYDSEEYGSEQIPKIGRQVSISEYDEEESSLDNTNVNILR